MESKITLQVVGLSYLAVQTLAYVVAGRFDHHEVNFVAIEGMAGIRVGSTSQGSYGDGVDVLVRYRGGILEEQGQRESLVCIINHWISNPTCTVTSGKLPDKNTPRNIELVETATI